MINRNRERRTVDEKITVELSEDHSITTHEKSIVGFGTVLYLNREPGLSDIEFVRLAYEAGINHQKMLTKRFLKTITE